METVPGNGKWIEKSRRFAGRGRQLMDADPARVIQLDNAGEGAAGVNAEAYSSLGSNSSSSAGSSAGGTANPTISR